MTSEPTLALESFVTFGDLLKYLRRRAHLTQDMLFRLYYENTANLDFLSQKSLIFLVHFQKG